ncbi:hypothetical protein F2Q70_00007616 [Brassica cretica]|uniref:50S ribosomal protein L33, chloroplastic n=1 Tax=Brassica cretica TaxID=69181 RepID=A0A8S9LQY4_BRACR|nr:hypothetical protein F2Q70_00007616 [Brassica cretica]
MGDKRKKTFMFIRLVSAAGTGFFYVKRKSSKGLLEKLEFRKYDPRVNRHVLFTEQKMKKKTFMFIRLVSAAGTGFFYVKRKSSKGLLEKLEFRKYDPRVNRHVLFTEQKMK